MEYLPPLKNKVKPKITSVTPPTIVLSLKTVGEKNTKDGNGSVNTDGIGISSITEGKKCREVYSIYILINRNISSNIKRFT